MNSEFHPHKVFKFCPKCGGTNFITHNLKAQKCQDCEFIFYTNAAAAVAAIIINEQGEVLLTTRAFDPSKGMLDLPGGFVDPGETIENALTREIKEELNLDIIASTYFGSFPNEYVYAGILYYTIDLVYLCKVSNLNQIKVDDDVTDYSFHAITSDTIQKIGLDSIKKILKTLVIEKQL